MRILAAALFFAILATPAFAANPADEAACAAHITELANSEGSKAYELVREQMIDEILIAYRTQGVPINATQISFPSESVLLTDAPWGIELRLEAKVDAGADSANFTVTSKMPLSTERVLVPHTFRDTKYDAIGRVESTRLLCTLSNSEGSWPMPLMNEATGHVIDEHYAGGTISTQIVLP